MCHNVMNLDFGFQIFIFLVDDVSFIHVLC